MLGTAAPGRVKDHPLCLKFIQSRFDSISMMMMRFLLILCSTILLYSGVKD